MSVELSALSHHAVGKLVALAAHFSHVPDEDLVCSIDAGLDLGLTLFRELLNTVGQGLVLARTDDSDADPGLLQHLRALHVGGDHTDGAHARGLAGVDFAGRRAQPIRCAVHRTVGEGGDRLHVVVYEADQLGGVIDAGDGATTGVNVQNDVLDAGVGRRGDHRLADLRVSSHAQPLIPVAVGVVIERPLDVDRGNAIVIHGQQARNIPVLVGRTITRGHPSGPGFLGLQGCVEARLCPRPDLLFRNSRHLKFSCQFQASLPRHQKI